MLITIGSVLVSIIDIDPRSPDYKGLDIAPIASSSSNLQSLDYRLTSPGTKRATLPLQGTTARLLV